MEKIIETMLETSVAQSQQIKSLCKSIEVLVDAVGTLHERIKVLEGNEGTESQTFHSRN